MIIESTCQYIAPEVAKMVKVMSEDERIAITSKSLKEHWSRQHGNKGDALRKQNEIVVHNS